jgi:hypothetical protein
MESSRDPKVKEELQRMEDSTFPESPYRGLRYALSDGDYPKARSEYEKLISIRKRSDIQNALNPKNQNGDWKPIGMTRETERKMLRGMTDDERVSLESARRERLEIFRRLKRIYSQQ